MSGDPVGPTEVVPFGDSALMVMVHSMGAAHRLASAIDRAAGDGLAPEPVAETVVGDRSVMVRLEAPVADVAVVTGWLHTLAGGDPAGPGGPRHAGPVPWSDPPVELPTVFDGPDLDLVAGLVGTDPGAVVEALTAAPLEVAFLGFSPGFPYLVGLPPALASVGRRSSPRVSVPAGSVAVAGGYAAVYPQSTPGGWMLLGRTATPLFDPDIPPFALLRPGDRVRFVESSEPGTDRADERAPDRASITPRPGERWCEVIHPGLLTTVQDGGRRGVAGIGVPAAGPCDPDAMALANLLVGNGPTSPALECTATGPTVRVAVDAHVALVGPAAGSVDLSLDGHPCATGAVVPVAAGQTVTVGRITGGLRAYLAVGGGFTPPPAVGSRSSDLLAGLGWGPLRAGDRVTLGPATRPHGLLSPAAVDGPDTLLGSAGAVGPRVISVVPGPHRPTVDAVTRLTGQRWTVGDQANRIGLQLRGADGGLPVGSAGVRSVGMVTGAVQVPPDGHPIVLLPDHATTGGYPVVATVITADQPVLGQLAPGDTLEFESVDLTTARRRWLDHRSALEGRVGGWFPTVAGT